MCADSLVRYLKEDVNGGRDGRLSRHGAPFVRVVVLKNYCELDSTCWGGIARCSPSPLRTIVVVNRRTFCFVFFSKNDGDPPDREALPSSIPAGERNCRRSHKTKTDALCRIHVEDARAELKQQPSFHRISSRRFHIRDGGQSVFRYEIGLVSIDRYCGGRVGVYGTPGEVLALARHTYSIARSPFPPPNETDAFLQAYRVTDSTSSSMINIPPALPSPNNTR